MRKPRPIFGGLVYIDCEDVPWVDGSIWLSSIGVKRLQNWLARYSVWIKEKKANDRSDR